MSPGYLVAQGPIPLTVNDAGNGDAPNATFKETVVTGILWSYYGRICEHFQSLGHTVFAASYDWRLGVKQNAEWLYGKILDWAEGDPLYLVGHSLGGMVGRGLLRLAADANNDAQFVRLLTLGTPHLGSLSIPRLWGHQGSFWILLYLAFYPTSRVLAFYDNRPGPSNILDDVIARLVSTYVLMPQPANPCFGFGYSYSLAMDAATYAGFNPFLRQDRFDAAMEEQDWLAHSVYPNQQLSVISRGLWTAQQVFDPKKLNFPEGYLFNLEGDSTVAVGSAELPNVRQIMVTGIEHQALPYDPAILPSIPGWLFGP
jgi:pimeloyl-ACP methyl ester carboxylesterase